MKLELNSGFVCHRERKKGRKIAHSLSAGLWIFVDAFGKNAKLARKGLPAKGRGGAVAFPFVLPSLDWRQDWH